MTDYHNQIDTNELTFLVNFPLAWRLASNFVAAATAASKPPFGPYIIIQMFFFSEMVQIKSVTVNTKTDARYITVDSVKK